MQLIIVGAGGLGREVLSWLTHDSGRRQEFSILGFLDDNPNALAGDYDTPVLSSVQDYRPDADHQLVIAMGNPADRRRVVEQLKAKNAKFHTLIHSNCEIGNNVKVGTGCIICPYCVLTCDIQLGDFVFLNASANVGHDVTIGDFTSANSGVHITGGVSVGEDCFIGVGAKVVPGRRIGAGAKIGAGSVVIDHVAEGTTVFGNPARPLATNELGKDKAFFATTDDNGDLENLAIQWVQENNQAIGDEFVVEANTDLIKTAILDSVGFIELIAFLEIQAGSKIDLAELHEEDIATISGLCNCLVKADPLASAVSEAPTTVIQSYSDSAMEYESDANQNSCWGAATNDALDKIHLNRRYKSILDVGCGTGRLLQDLASNSPADVRFVGIEPAEEMRKVAQDRLSEFANISIADGRFEELPIPSRSVDYLYSTFAFHWVTDVDAAVREIKRALSEDGEMDLFFTGRDTGREFTAVTTPVFLKYMGASGLCESTEMRNHLTRETALKLFGDAFKESQLAVEESFTTYRDDLDGHWSWWQARATGHFAALPAHKRNQCYQEIRKALETTHDGVGVPYTVHALHVKVRTQ